MDKQVSDIDIVFPWVDSSDPIWRKEYNSYSKQNSGDNSEYRFRDWNLLKYVFRGIEQNMPWVRKVHFITFGHLPEWLNTDCSKLHIVYHEDYIPEEWLPTFNANPIELNLHRISELSERFIYMNDDMFILKPMKEEDFFVGNKPKSQAGLDIIQDKDPVFTGILHSDLRVINRNFSNRAVYPKTISKFINIRYAMKENIKSALLSFYCLGYYPGFSFFHGPNAYLKSTFRDVWCKESLVLNETCSHKFREYTDINQYLFLWWQWCQGDFIPNNLKRKLTFCSVDKDVDGIVNKIIHSITPIVCINDNEIETENINRIRERLIDAFETVFKENSSFEK